MSKITPNVEVFTGHITVNGHRTQIDFQTRINASKAEKDAAMLESMSAAGIEFDYGSMGTTVDESQPPARAVDQVKSQLIEAIREKGLHHTLTWIREWYTKAARAMIEDENNLQPPIRELHLTAELIRLSRSATNKSTSQGSNMLTEARIEALAEMVDRSEVMRSVNNKIDALRQARMESARQAENDRSRAESQRG